MLIFGEVSDALVCPTAGSGGGGGGPLVFLADYFENNIMVAFNPPVVGIIGDGAYQEGISTLEDQGEFRYGVPSDWNFLHSDAVGSSLVSINIWVKGDFVGGPTYPIIDTFHCSFYDLTCVAYGGTLTGTPPDGVVLHTQSGSLGMFIDQNGVQVHASYGISAPPNDGQWHMVTVTYDKSTQTNFMTKCVDAVCSTNNDGGGFFDGTSNNAVSTLTVGSTHGLNGGTTENGFAVDELTIWNGYRLTGSDITALYNGGLGLSSSGISPGTQVLHDTYELTEEGTPEVAGETGAEQCLQAKDTAWTVIAILPVALFFGLFAIFSSLGVTRPT